MLESIFTFLVCSILYVYIGFPLVLMVLSKFYKNQSVKLCERDKLPFVSIIVVVRNGEAYIKDKLINCLTLDYPEERREVIVMSDGSTDGTAEQVRQFADRHVRLIESPMHRGKNASINEAILNGLGDIYIFTDASAIIEKGALIRIVSWFRDNRIGGICGQKVFRKSSSQLGGSQKTYLSYEDNIRRFESMIASIASNEGFFYAIRRTLTGAIPEGVTDDLYTAMSVISKGSRFIYDQEARAFLPVRAKTPSEELQRRRRIVCGSLRGIMKMKQLLNPFQFPLYAWILFSHKVARRLLPLLLITIFLVNIILLKDQAFFVVTFLLQLTGYSAFIATHYGFLSLELFPGTVKKVFENWYYFCLGNIGTFLGMIDVCRGVSYSKWNPVQERTAG